MPRTFFSVVEKANEFVYQIINYHDLMCIYT